MANELSTRTDNLREKAARFKLRAQQEGIAIPGSLTPQMLETCAQTIRQSPHTTLNHEEIAFETKEQPIVKLAQGWDKKGYEHF